MSNSSDPRTVPNSETTTSTEFAVVGCGSIAQIFHLPNIRDRTDTELVAVCDTNDKVRNRVEERFHPRESYGDLERMLDQHVDELDGVLVCTPSHVHRETVLPVLERDLNVFVEKPLAVQPDDADEIVDAADTADCVSMVGYMKRYHPTVQAGIEQIDTLDSIDLVTARDIDPDHGTIIQELYDTVRPSGELGPANPHRREQIADVLGTPTDSVLVDAYSFQIEHVCHDINLLRGTFGEVKSIDHVDVFNGERYMVAQLRYEDGTRCVLESGVSDWRWFEEYLRVDGESDQITLTFGNPFRKQEPPTLETATGTSTNERTHAEHSYQDSFALELDAFVDAVRGDGSVLTPVDAARDDVEVVADLVRRYADSVR